MELRHAAIALVVAGLSVGVPLHAQTPIEITADFDISYVLGTEESTYSGTGTIEPFGAATLNATEIFSGAAATINATFSISSGDNFSATSSEVTASGNQCSVPFTITGGTGIFNNATGSLTLNYACFPVSTSVGSFEVSGTGSITITSPAKLSLSPTALTFSFQQGGPSSSSQPVFLSNQGAQAANFTATTGGETWLSVSPGKGSVAAFGSTTLTITATITGLAPGTYAGTVNVSGAGQAFVVAITLTISATRQSLVLSQSGLQFAAATGAGPPPGQSIVVLNPGTGSLEWTATASALSGDWLSVSPASGVAGGSAVVTANQANLQAGDHYGIVQFAASGAANSPQIAVVVFHVFPGNCFPSCGAGAVPISVQPTGLIFVAAQGGASPPPQTVTVANPSTQSFTVSAAPTSQQNRLFSVSPTSASISSGSPAQFAVSLNASGVTAGVYTGNLELQFSDGSTQEVALLAIVLPAGSLTAPRSASTRHTAAPSNCTPTKLLPVSTALSQNFNITVAWPTPLEVTVVDDCGSPMGAGSVVASFSSGDPPISLAALGNGDWSGTWQPAYEASPESVVITVAAQSVTPALSGSALISGSLQPNAITPSIYAHGVVSTASFQPNAPLAPGAFASIFGVNLAQFTALASALPLPSELGGAQAIIAGRLTPIQYSSGGQINVLIPYDLPPNSTQQLIVQQGLAYSTPETITIAPAQPAVFTQNQSGHGAGTIVVVKPNGTQFNADPSHPASVGDALVIYCTGLGAVDQQVEAGSGSPGSPADKISNAVTVTIGDVPAPVSFAGLTPTYAGLYQVNVTVPSGIKPGPSVPVVLTMGALSSAPVTIAIQ